MARFEELLAADAEEPVSYQSIRETLIREFGVHAFAKKKAKLQSIMQNRSEGTPRLRPAVSQLHLDEPMLAFHEGDRRVAKQSKGSQSRLSTKASALRIAKSRRNNGGRASLYYR